MKKFFYLPAWITSLLCSLLSGGLFCMICDAENCILWVGGFLLTALVFGFLGMRLAFWFSKKYRLPDSKSWIARLLVCALLIGGAGMGGQALFMSSKEEVIIPATVDIALLLDASSSMDFNGYNTPRTDAANQFVDSLDDASRLQVVSFTGTVLDSTSLLTMDDAGKQTAHQLINGIDSIGMTDLNAPLRLAMETLDQQARIDSNRVVILLTDGEGDLASDVASDLIDKEIRVFTVRIDSSSYDSAQAKALIALAQKSGGFDTKLSPDAAGKVDASALLTAFHDAFQASAEERTVMLDELLLCSETVTPYQFMIRLVTLWICAVLFGVAYYGWSGIKALLLNMGSGVLLTILLTICGENMGVCMVLICLFLAAACSTLEIEGGDTLDV